MITNSKKAFSKVAFYITIVVIAAMLIATTAFAVEYIAAAI